jgi:hypothetical protein
VVTIPGTPVLVFRSSSVPNISVVAIPGTPVLVFLSNCVPNFTRLPPAVRQFVPPPNKIAKHFSGFPMMPFYLLQVTVLQKCCFESCVRRMGAGEVGRSEGKRLLLRPRSRRENNIKIYVKGFGCGMNWIDLARDTDRWRAAVNAAMNSRFP